MRGPGSLPGDPRTHPRDSPEADDADAWARLIDLAEGSADRFQTRIFHDDATSFHPKAYLFWSSDGRPAAGFVGTSNLSRAGLSGGVKWNVGVNYGGSSL